MKNNLNIVISFTWIICCSLMAMCDDTIRLVGGPTPSSGRVELYVNGIWGTVCGRMWTEEDARVACYQLGLQDGGRAVRHAAFGEGEGPIQMSHVQCTGDETSLSECPKRTGACDHDEDAGVVCLTDETNSATGRLRLTDGPTNTSGRLEVEFHGVWGTVCRDKWNIQDSRVVCRNLGYCEGSSVKHDEGAFGTGTGPVWLSEKGCTGEEDELSQCRYSDWGTNTCEHHSDVGVVCEYCPTGTIKLSGGPDHSSGIVTISNSGIWGTVCETQPAWENNEARVVCRQLGFADGIPADSKNFSDVGGAIWLNEVQCSGWETMLTSCQHDASESGGWGENDCRHYQDVSVKCLTTVISTTRVTTNSADKNFTTPVHTTKPGSSVPGVSITQPLGASSPAPGPNKDHSTTITIVCVVVGALVVIVTVVALVYGITKVKTTRAKHTIMLNPRGRANDYMLTNDVNAEGACAIALVPRSNSNKSRDSGVYQEIPDKEDPGCRRNSRNRNTYVEEPAHFQTSNYREGQSADPLPAVPGGYDEGGYMMAADAHKVAAQSSVAGPSASSHGDHYMQIPEENNSDYLAPLNLK